jgi:hypothetical protein
LNITALENIKRGEIVYNQYGDRSSHDSFLLYGFVLNENDKNNKIELDIPF